MTKKYYEKIAGSLNLKQFIPNPMFGYFRWLISHKYRKYKAMHQFVRDPLLNPDPQLHSLSWELMKKDEDKTIINDLKWVYYNIKYQSETGDEWAEPLEIYNTRKDDCEGQNSLIYHLARMANVRPEQLWCWIGDTTFGYHFALLYYSTTYNEWFVIDAALKFDSTDIKYRTPFKNQSHIYIRTDYLFNEDICLKQKI